MHHRPEVKKAKADIALILKKLEEDTGSLVKELSLSFQDATTLEDDRQQRLMQVNIELFRLPGHFW